jgi:hypothetical protein
MTQAKISSMDTGPTIHRILLKRTRKPLVIHLHLVEHVCLKKEYGKKQNMAPVDAGAVLIRRGFPFI